MVNKYNIKTKGLSKKERVSLLIDYWKQTSNVQQHFNDVSMKLRNFAVVVFSGFLTGVGLAIHKNISIYIMGRDISAGVLFALAGLIATQLIHFMDTYWYHVFLKGAVNTSASIESEIKKILGVKELSNDISSDSQKVEIVSLLGKLHFPIGWKSFLSKTIILKKVEVNSTKRHKVFYRWLLAIFVVTGIGSEFTHSTDESKNKETPLHVIIEHEKNHIKENKSQESNSISYIISGSNVRLRSGAGFDSEIINHLPIGKKITIKENKNSSWIEVMYKDENNNPISGWVHRDFVEKIK